MAKEDSFIKIISESGHAKDRWINRLNIAMRALYKLAHEPVAKEAIEEIKKTFPSGKEK